LVAIFVLWLLNTAAAWEREHIPVPRKITCNWNTWAEWSDCSVSCGEGNKWRSRELREVPKGAGKDACAGPRNQTTACLNSCRVDKSVTRVMVSSAMTVRNIDHAKLSHEDRLREKFEAKMKQAIAEEVGHGVEPRDIDMRLSAGSVRVEFDISPPKEDEVRGVEGALRKSTTMSYTVETRIEEEKDLSEASFGPISVDQLDDPVVKLPATTTTATRTTTLLVTKTTTTHTTTPRLPEPVEARIRWSKNPSKCFDVHAGIAKNGNVPWIWDCGETRDELFLLDEGGIGRIRWKTFPNLCLNAPSGKELMWWDCEASNKDNILFHVPKEGHGHIVLASRPNKCVGLPLGEKDNGVWFRMYDCNDHPESLTTFQVDVFDCVWGEWSEWSKCSSECGGGRRDRSAVARGLAEAAAGRGICAGELRQSMPCNRQSCGAPASGAEVLLHPAAAFLRLDSDPRWCLSISDSVTLQRCADDARLLYMLPASGVGLIRWRQRPQQCLDAPGGRQVQMWDCNTSPADHVNFTFSANGDAQTICLASRKSSCLYALKETEGQEVKIGKCEGKKHACIKFKAQFVDCAWDGWAEWSECSAKCGGGTRTRSRVHSTTKTILSCQADVVEDVTVPCNEDSCQ